MIALHGHKCGYFLIGVCKHLHEDAMVSDRDDLFSVCNFVLAILEPGHFIFFFHSYINLVPWNGPRLVYSRKSFYNACKYCIRSQAPFLTQFG